MGISFGEFNSMFSQVYIKGKRLEHVSLGGYAMFISEDSFNKGGDEVTFIKRVEDVALNYYREQGYTQGKLYIGHVFRWYGSEIPP